MHLFKWTTQLIGIRGNIIYSSPTIRGDAVDLNMSAVIIKTVKVLPLKDNDYLQIICGMRRAKSNI